MTNDNKTLGAPAGFVDHVLEYVVSEDLSTEENFRAIIEETWTRAQQDKPGDLHSVVERYVDADVVLSEKVARIRNVIRNTLRKRNLEAPERFRWVMAWGEYKVQDIYHNEAESYQNPRNVSISGKRLNGINMGVDAVNDSIVISVGGARPERAIIPLRWLTLSDGDLSSMVRKEVRKEADKKRSERRALLLREKELVQKNLNKLLKELEEMEKKVS